MLLTGLPQLLGRNLDQIGAAHAQVEPLFADGLVAGDLDLVHKGPALPAGVIRSESEVSIRDADRLKGSRADERSGE